VSEGAHTTRETVMSPGINDGGPRNTGTLPKSNRRNDRNRERSAVNQQIANRTVYHSQSQHFNNLVNPPRATDNFSSCSSPWLSVFLILFDESREIYYYCASLLYAFILCTFVFLLFKAKYYYYYIIKKYIIP